MKMKNIRKKRRLIIVCVLLSGIAVGTVACWRISVNHSGKQESVIAESLEDEFWNNGFATGDNATVTQPETGNHVQKHGESQTSAEKTIYQSETVPYRGGKFILNTSSKKIHTPDCASVKNIDPQNYSETDDFLNALSKGYTQCKQCYPID